MDEIFELMRSSRLLVRCYHVPEAEHIISWLVERGMEYGGWNVAGAKYPMRIGINPHSNRVDGWSADASVFSYFRHSQFPEPDIVEYAEWDQTIQILSEQLEKISELEDIPDELM